MKNYYSTSSATGKPTGVRGYEYGSDYVIVHFTSGSKYTYTIESCGSMHIENIKQHADSQSGLNSYLTRHKPRHSSKS